MAEIRGLCGMHFNTEKAGAISTLVCPPYDIISDQQREEYLQCNPYNIIRLELPKGENRYKDAGNTLNEWLDEQILVKDSKESIYVYEIEFKNGANNKKLKGFVSLVKLVEFSKGIVLPHEETLSKAKTDRFNLMSETFCNFSQIYSLYMDEDGSAFSAIDKCSSGNPDFETTDNDGVIHRIWAVNDEAIILELSEIFSDKKLYIADGHHRYETALNFHKHLCEKGISNEDSLSGYVMMMLVNMENDGLVVLPTHRIVRDLDGFDLEKLLQKCSEYFDINKYENAEYNIAEEILSKMYDSGEKAYALYAGKCFYIMKLRDKNALLEFLPDMSEAYRNLDVSILHSLVLERIFGIDKENMANQVNLTYTKITAEAVKAVDDGAANCAFILNPTRVSEIRDVALAGEKMPQKSTYFYPKLITGLVMNKF